MSSSIGPIRIIPAGQGTDVRQNLVVDLPGGGFYTVPDDVLYAVTVTITHPDGTVEVVKGYADYRLDSPYGVDLILPIDVAPGDGLSVTIDVADPSGGSSVVQAVLVGPDSSGIGSTTSGRTRAQPASSAD